MRQLGEWLLAVKNISIFQNHSVIHKMLTLKPFQLLSPLLSAPPVVSSRVGFFFFDASADSFSGCSLCLLLLLPWRQSKWNKSDNVAAKWKDFPIIFITTTIRLTPFILAFWRTQHCCTLIYPCILLNHLRANWSVAV